MRLLTWIVFLVVAGASTFYLRHPVIPDGIVRFSQPVYDLGIVAPGADQAIMMTVANTTDSKATVSVPRPSCSCTSVTIDHRVIDSNSQATVRALVRTSNREGPVDVEIVAEVDNSTTKVIKTKIIGWIQPASAILVRPLQLEFVKKGSATIVTTGPEIALQNVKINCNDTALRFALGPITDIVGSLGIKSRVVTITNDSNPASITQRSTVFVTTTKGQEKVIVIRPAIEEYIVSPKIIFLGIMDAGSVARGVFFVKKATQIRSIPPNVKISRFSNGQGSDRCSFTVKEWGHSTRFIAQSIQLENEDKPESLTLSWFQE